MTTLVEIGNDDQHDQRSGGTRHDAEVSFEIQPFGIAPDARMIFVHPHFDEVRKGLLNTILLDNGFGVVTGEVGSGKTTLLHRVIADLPPDFEVAVIMNTCLKPDELLLAIADDLGIATRPASAGPVMERRELLSAIGARLDVNFEAGRRTIVIIDEAQHLSDETLELVRMLSNLKSEGGKGVQFLFFGQEQLRERLLRPELQSFVSRIGAQYALNPLTLAETEEYVRHRLAASRPSRPVTLSEKAVGCLFRASSGLPRRINIVAGNALQRCLADHRREINTKDIITAAKAATLPFDRRTRERHYSTAAAWILFLALSGFAARQYYVKISGIPPVAVSIPSPTAAESAPIASALILVAADSAVAPSVDTSVTALEAPPSPPSILPPSTEARVVEAPSIPTSRARSLSGNMRGPDVTRLQVRLAELGYFTAPPTDKFGRATLAAVQAFQRERRIPEQGVAGPRTLAALYGAQAQPVRIEPPRPSSGARSLSGNMRGPDVTRLQMRLAELGYFTVPPTDKFGRATLAAVQAFQRERGIREHGVAGPQTFAALYGTDAADRPDGGSAAGAKDGAGAASEPIDAR